MIRLEPVSLENAMDIYNFEIENRSFFESMLPSRGDDYYQLDHFMTVINGICDDQRSGILYMNLIRNEQNEMVGRINLFPISHEHYNCAFELGYRMAEAHQGKGYATKAVEILTNQAFEAYDIDCLQALTSPKNIASQQILIKNQFSLIKRISNDVMVNGELEDSLVYERPRL